MHIYIYIYILHKEYIKLIWIRYVSKLCSEVNYIDIMVFIEQVDCTWLSVLFLSVPVLWGVHCTDPYTLYECHIIQWVWIFGIWFVVPVFPLAMWIQVTNVKFYPLHFRMGIFSSIICKWGNRYRRSWRMVDTK